MKFKKILLISIICVMGLMISSCGNNNEDALKFKEEYEAVNGETTSSGKTIRTLDIAEKNPMVYKSAGDIVKSMNNKESFVVYFGFAKCPWCRSVINTLIETANELKIKKVYYVDVYDIRDVREVGSDGTVTTKTEGSEDYMKLVEMLDNVLEDYSLTNKAGETVSAGEKRIYAPNVVVVKKGEAVAMSTGISDKETDPYMDLTDEILNDTKIQFTDLLKQLNN